MLDDFNDKLKSRVLLDLTNRSRGGIFLYITIWFMTTIWAGLPKDNPIFFYFNSFVILLLFFLRLHFYLVIKNNPKKNVGVMSRQLIFTIIICSAHWGLVTAWIIYNQSYQDLHYIYIIVVAFAVSGSSNLSISKEIRTTFPYLILGPSLLVGIIAGGSESYLLVSMGFIGIAYVVSTSKVAASDYWYAIHNHYLAESRAKLMEELSTTDPLTNLKNRLYFNNQYSIEWKRCSRDKAPISLMMIDLDYFKKVNDTYGHQFGDACLIEVASILSKKLTRETDTVARYGGEEFIVLLPNTSLKDAKYLAENIVRSVSMINLDFESKAVFLSCSIGLQSIIPSVNGDQSALIKAADHSLYIAKNLGRNQYFVAE